jgi:hypothetical protein
MNLIQTYTNIEPPFRDLYNIVKYHAHKLTKENNAMNLPLDKTQLKLKLIKSKANNN